MPLLGTYWLCMPGWGGLAGGGRAWGAYRGCLAVVRASAGAEAGIRTWCSTRRRGDTGPGGRRTLAGAGRRRTGLRTCCVKMGEGEGENGAIYARRRGAVFGTLLCLHGSPARSLYARPLESGTVWNINNLHHTSYCTTRPTTLYLCARQHPPTPTPRTFSKNASHWFSVFIWLSFSDE